MGTALVAHDTPARRANVVSLLEDQATTLGWFEREQAYLRRHQPPALILRGPHIGYMPAAAGRAHLRDLPEAKLHVLDAGHWALETNLEEIVPSCATSSSRSPARPEPKRARCRQL